MILITDFSEYFDNKKINITEATPEDAFNTYWVFRYFFENHKHPARLGTVESGGRRVALRRDLLPMETLGGDSSYFDLEKKFNISETIQDFSFTDNSSPNLSSSFNDPNFIRRGINMLINENLITFSDIKNEKTVSENEAAYDYKVDG